MSYQALLHDAIALLKAERGFIVLYDPFAKTFGDYVASRNFDPLPWHWNSTITQEPFREINYLWDLMTEIIDRGQPALTDNVPSSQYYARPCDRTGWSLRFVLAVPLVFDGLPYGLLYCDQRMLEARWTSDNIPPIVELVQAFLR